MLASGNVEVAGIARRRARARAGRRGDARVGRGHGASRGTGVGLGESAARDAREPDGHREALLQAGHGRAADGGVGAGGVRARAGARQRRGSGCTGRGAGLPRRARLGRASLLFAGELAMHEVSPLAVVGPQQPPPLLAPVMPTGHGRVQDDPLDATGVEKSPIASPTLHCVGSVSEQQRSWVRVREMGPGARSKRGRRVGAADYRPGSSNSRCSGARSPPWPCRL